MVRGGDEMKKNEKTSMSKRRATVAAVLCFVAAIAIAGTYTFNDYRKTQKNEPVSYTHLTLPTKLEV